MLNTSKLNISRLNTSRLNLKQEVLVQPLNIFKAIERRTKLSEEQLLNKAFSEFEDNYPKWAESCFDIYFLTHSGKEALAAEDAEGLAKAYMAQLKAVSTINYQQRVDAVKTIAEAFLIILATQKKNLEGNL